MAPHITELEPLRPERLYPHGDPVAEYLRWKGNKLKKTAAKSSLIGVGAFMPVLSNGLTEFLTAEDAIAGGVMYSAPMALAVGTESLIRSRLAKNRYRQSLLRAERIEDTIGEPVDVLVTKDKKAKQPEAVLRWYGLDGRDSLPVDATQRVDALLAGAEGLGVNRIAVGTAWLGNSELLDREDSEQVYGSLVEGETAVMTLKNGSPKKRAVLLDHAVDEHVLVTTREQLKNLLDDHQAEQESSTIEFLIDKLGNARIKELYTLYQHDQPNQHDQPEAAALLRRGVRLYLEREIDEGATSYGDKQPNGMVERHKAAVTASVEGDMLRRKLDFHDRRANESRTKAGDSTPLLEVAGAETIDELMQNIAKDSGSTDKKSMLIALHLLLQNQDSDIRHMGMAGGSGTQNVESLFSRLRAGQSEQYETKRPYSRKARVLAVLGGLAAGAVLSAGSGLVSHETWNNFFESGYTYKANFLLDTKGEDSRGAPYIKKDSPEHAQYLDYLKANHEYMALFKERVANLFSDMNDFDETASGFLLKQFVEQLGIEQLAGLAKYADYADTEWQKKLIETRPSNLENLELSTVGDAVSADENRTNYVVNALTGGSTEGYWYTGMDDTSSFLEVGITPYKSRRPYFSLGAPQSSVAEIPKNQKTIDSKNPDFMVETPYMGINNQSLDAGYVWTEAAPLPVKIGTSVVGAYIYDKDHPELVSDKFDILQFSDGSYKVKLKTDNALASDEASLTVNGVRLQNPQLRYYLKDLPGSKSEVTYTGALKVIDSETFESLDKDDVTMIATKTRRALGLGKDASSAEIYEAIKAKKYSYTPFETSGVDTIDLTGMSDANALAKVGETIAKMEAIHCGVAQALTIYSTLDKENGIVAAGGVRNNDDNFLTDREAHAWNMGESTKIIDNTSDTFAAGQQSMDKPTDRGKTKEVHPSTELNPSVAGGAVLMAAVAFVAYRRREQLGRASDALRTRVVTGLPDAQDALAVINQVAYASPESELRWSSSTIPDSGDKTSREIQKKYIATVPRGGITISEAREHAKRYDQKISLPLQIAIGALRQNDAAIRRRDARQ